MLGWQHYSSHNWGAVSPVVVVLLSSPLLKGKGHVDLFLGKFFFSAGQMPDWTGTLRGLTGSKPKTDLWS